MRTAPATRLTHSNLIQNWFEELKAKVPVRSRAAVGREDEPPPGGQGFGATCGDCMNRDGRR